jgi:hypothetical protein
VGWTVPAHPMDVLNLQGVYCFHQGHAERPLNQRSRSPRYSCLHAEDAMAKARLHPSSPFNPLPRSKARPPHAHMRPVSNVGTSGTSYGPYRSGRALLPPAIRLHSTRLSGYRLLSVAGRGALGFFLSMFLHTQALRSRTAASGWDDLRSTMKSMGGLTITRAVSSRVLPSSQLFSPQTNQAHTKHASRPHTMKLIRRTNIPLCTIYTSRCRTIPHHNRLLL